MITILLLYICLQVNVYLFIYLLATRPGFTWIVVLFVEHAVLIQFIKFLYCVRLSEHDKNKNYRTDFYTIFTHKPRQDT